MKTKREFKTCTHLTELPKDFKWDTSNCAEFMLADNMNEAQINFCMEHRLFENYSMIGFAAIIDSSIKKQFKRLK